MKICIIQLQKDREHLTKQCISNYPEGVITCLVDDFSKEFVQHYPYTEVIRNIEHKGISFSINEGIDYAKSIYADAVVLMANDILMPNGWLEKMVICASTIKNTGFVGIHCVEDRGTLTNIEGVQIELSEKVFGNVLLPMAAIDKIGYFNEDYDPYGVQDADYCYRLNKTGHINYYLPELSSTHIGHDVGDGSEYRKMKDDSLNIKWQRLNYWQQYYDINGYKIER
jgi:GT2 family glycosyltransferase